MTKKRKVMRKKSPTEDVIFFEGTTDFFTIQKDKIQLQPKPRRRGNG